MRDSRAGVQWTLGMLFLLSMITYFDRVAIAVAGTDIQRDLGLSASQWGWVLGIFALSYALFEIPTGAMGDRLGPRKVLTRIVVWWSAFTSLTGAAGNYWSLLAARVEADLGHAPEVRPGIAVDVLQRLADLKQEAPVARE